MEAVVVVARASSTARIAVRRTHAHTRTHTHARPHSPQADAVLHFGTHGSLEFMPGKQVGMSDACYPDSLIGSIPNIYYYAANNPSEATIAKRRSYANTISYLTPPAENAGLYKGLKARRVLCCVCRVCVCVCVCARALSGWGDFRARVHACACACAHAPAAARAAPAAANATVFHLA